MNLFIDEIVKASADATKGTEPLGKVVDDILTEAMRIAISGKALAPAQIMEQAKAWRTKLIVSSIRLSTRLYELSMVETLKP